VFGVVLPDQKGNTNLQNRDDVWLVLFLLLLELQKKLYDKKIKHVVAPKTM
jgi:hypothetical protein